MADLAVFEQDQQAPAAPQVFISPANPPMVPKNPAELAAQIAAVDEKQLEMPFTQRMSKAAQDLQQAGAPSMLADVALRERQDNLNAAVAHAQAIARTGDVPSLQAAAVAIQQQKDALGTTPSITEGSKAVASRVLEDQAVQFMAGRYKTPADMAMKLDQESDYLGLRNLLNYKRAELEDRTSFGEKVANFFTTFIPFAQDFMTNREISKYTGVQRYFDTAGAVEDFRSYWNGLDNEQKLEVARSLSKAKMGLTGDNLAATADFIGKIAELTRTDAAVDQVFNALGATGVTEIGKGLAWLMRRGAPVKALSEAAGNEAAAKVAVADLVSGSGMSGLNDADLMARMLSIGKNPLDADPAAFAGMSAPAQTELRQAWNDVLEQTRSRLISSGLTPEEVKQGLADIRAKYSTETNQSIHSVIFGEGSATGQDMQVFWQSADGRAFGSKEAAEAWAKAEGKVNYQVVPKNQAQFAELDDLDFTKAAAPKIASAESGNVLNASKERVVNLLDRMSQSTTLGDPMAEQLLDHWKQAAAKGRSGINAEAVLKTIASQSADADYRLLAEHLLSTENKGINWRSVGIELHYDMGRLLGGYLPGKNKVQVPLRAASDPEMYIHELVHAHNSQVITLVSGAPQLAAKLLTKDQIQSAKSLIELHKRTKNWWENSVMKESEKYGSMIEDLGDIFTNKKLRFAVDHPAELLAYGLTNSKVRAVLQKVKLSELGYAGEEASVWSKLWDSFKGVLGLRSNDTVLAKLAGIQDNLAAHIDDTAQTILTDMSKAGMVSNADIQAMMGAGSRGLYAARKGGKKAVAKTPPPAAAPTEEWLVQEHRADPIAFKNVGKFSEEDIRSMPWIALDPKHAASELAVEERVIGVHAEAKTRRDLTSFLTPFFDKLSGAGRRRVKSVLEEGDSVSNVGAQTGKEFSYPELRAKGLSEPEATAYFAARQARMIAYHLRNGQMVRTLRAEGFKEVELLGSGEKYAGKVLSQDEASASLGKVAYDTTTGKPYMVDSTTIEDSYKGGKRIVSLRQPVQLGDKHYSTLVVDDTTAKARDIHTAIGYRPGEFSRIYTDQYFIRVAKVAEVDGKVQEMAETVRTAASAREAQEYVEAHKKAIALLFDDKVGKAPRNLDKELEKLVGRYQDVGELRRRFTAGELDGYTNMDWHYTRNVDEFLNGSIGEAITNGRLFTSKRSDRLFSVDADRRNTKDVFESLEAEITNISRVANITQWRESMIRRWMNTFGDMVPARTGNDVADFLSVAGGKFTKNTPEASFARRTHEYILRQIGVSTGEETFYQNVTRMLTEKLFTGNEPIERVGTYIRQKGWLGFLRNVNFNLNLGMFNPAQLLVQANGAVTAAILSPVHGAKAAYTFPLLRMALMSDNPEVWRNLARVEKLKTLGLTSEAEFVDLVKAVRKSGILANMQSTALWNLEDGALNVFNGYPRKVLGSHTFFFNRGEEFSRLVSFDTARREFMAAHPGKVWNSDDALKQIVVRMDDLTQNMTKANLARFQTGVLSIPFQFAQYNIKLAANISTAFLKGGSGRGFSRTEATQLLLGHIVMYGAAGNGLTWAMDEVLGNSIKDKLSPETKNLLAQGLVAWVFDQTHKALTGEGAKVAIGSRLGSFDYYQRIGEAIYKDPANVYEALLGPTVSSAKRLGAIGDVAKLWIKDPDLSGRDVLEGLGKMGTEQVASLRNAAKAYLFYQHGGKMLDAQGVPTAQLRNNELLWQALGFQPTAAVDLNNLIKSKKDHGDALDDIAKQVLRVQRDILTAMKEGDKKRADEHTKLLQALLPDNSGDLREVQRRVRDRLYPYDTEMQKLIGEYMWRGQTYNKPTVVTEEPKQGVK